MQIPGGNRPGATIPLVTVVAIVMLGAIAFAIPPSRLEISAKTGKLGYLAGHAEFSTVMASQLANDGYNMLAIDLTQADLAKDALWRAHLNRVAEVQFPVWAFVRSDKIDQKRLERIAGGANVSGIFLYGAGASEHAKLVRAMGGMPIVVVHREGEPLPEGFDTAVALPFDRFMDADPASFRVLLAGTLGRRQIEEARAQAKGNYLVARIPLD